MSVCGSSTRSTAGTGCRPRPHAEAGTATRDAFRRLVSKKRHAKLWLAWINGLRDADLTPQVRADICARLKARKAPPEGQEMGNAASVATASSVCSYVQPIIEEYVDMRTDLEHARDTVLAQQEVIDMQAAALRALQNRLESLQGALGLALAENEALLEERRQMEQEALDMERAARAAQRERDEHARDVAVFNATMKLLVEDSRATTTSGGTTLRAPSFIAAA